MDSIDQKIRDFVLGLGYEEFQNLRGPSFPEDPAVVVRTERRDGNSILAVAVTPTKVILFRLSTPYAHNYWEVAEQHRYSSPSYLEEMLKIVCQRPLGCWKIDFE